jgi:hypothetical protein
MLSLGGRTHRHPSQSLRTLPINRHTPPRNQTRLRGRRYAHRRSVFCNNTADILTKTLQPPLHAKHCAPLHILNSTITAHNYTLHNMALFTTKTEPPERTKQSKRRAKKQRQRERDNQQHQRERDNQLLALAQHTLRQHIPHSQPTKHRTTHSCPTKKRQRHFSPHTQPRTTHLPHTTTTHTPPSLSHTPVSATQLHPLSHQKETHTHKTDTHHRVLTHASLPWTAKE